MRIQKIMLLLTTIALAACSSEADNDTPGLIIPPAKETPELLKQSRVYKRHKDSSLKILAIGNSFTHNAATYLPYLIDAINADSICLAKLTKSGCSLSQHWDSHTSDLRDYDFYYSDSGDWEKDDLSSIDDALALFSWDIIVIQQSSGDSGIYSYYQPYLDNLVDLFRTTNPQAELAWHYTWAYRENTDHPYFLRYDCSPEKMYYAILNACDRASEGFDIKIPSATLIWEMREKFPEAKNQFSDDGYHISDPLALYGLSNLWYQCLITPITKSGSLTYPYYPEGVDRSQMEDVRAIIKQILTSSKGS